MKPILGLVLAIMAAVNSFAQTPASSAAPGTWKPLSDGKTFTGWEQVGHQWKIEGGAFVCSDRALLRTADKFRNFELELEWRMKPNANGGVFYALSSDEQDGGFEMQLCDPAHSGITQPGGLYGLLSPSRDASKPLGSWNSARIVVNGKHREHYINNIKVLSYDLDSPEYQAALNSSKLKFKSNPVLLSEQAGAIALQSIVPGAEVGYRKIRIRELPSKP
jgi:hypothetical protein